MLSTSVMIVDPNLNITFLNRAARTLMIEAEPDLKTELPQFSAATLIGVNIDMFYKDAAQSRAVLSRLEKPASGDDLRRQTRL